MDKNLSVDSLSLALSFGLVLISVFVSSKEKLGISKDILWSVVRAIIQLTIIGFILQYLFELNNIWFTLLMCLFIISNASYHAHKRNPNPYKVFWHSFSAIFFSTSITLVILVFSGSIQFIPGQMIAITGMIASNSMVGIGLCYKQMNTQFHDLRQQVLEKLALGAPIKLASLAILQTSIKTAMQPTIDSAKTLGLVTLPGMMSGLIFAGVSPVHAIQYQIMVTFMLLSATSIGSVLAGYFSYRKYFNERNQLN